jgi:hypothetical protein
LIVRTMRAVRALQPVTELVVEVSRRGERAAGHERGLEEPVASLDDAFGLRVIRRQLHDPGRERAGERGNPTCEATTLTDAGLVVQINRRGTRPSSWINSHEPSSRSCVLRVGNIRPVMNRECAATITSTGSSALDPSSNGIRFGGNHRSHCAASPAPRPTDQPGPDDDTQTATAERRPGTTWSTPAHSTRPAITVAGISGCSAKIARTLATNGVNDIALDARSYFGGRSDATARTTVAHPIPNCRATCPHGTPSATSRRINTQSSTKITHPICLGGLVFDRRYGLAFKRRRHSLRHDQEWSPLQSASSRHHTATIETGSVRPSV